MHQIRSLVLLGLGALVSAQSAPDFPIQTEENLRVDYQTSSLSIKAGELVDRDSVLDEPTIVGPSDSSRTVDYMVFIIDQDVTSSTSSTKQQFLHWYQPNLSGASEVLFDGGQDTTNFTSAPTLEYVPPTPPAGDPAHKYTVIMYHQPQGFSIPQSFASAFQEQSDLSNRLGFDIAGFVSASGLGDPVSATWFQVQNGDGSGASTTTSAPPSTTTSQSDSTRTSFVTTTPPEASTSTAVVLSTVPPSTETTPPNASASASASGTPIGPADGSGAGMVDVRSSMGGLIAGLALSGCLVLLL